MRLSNQVSNGNDLWKWSYNILKNVCSFYIFKGIENTGAFEDNYKISLPNLTFFSEASFLLTESVDDKYLKEIQEPTVNEENHRFLEITLLNQNYFYFPLGNLLILKTSCFLHLLKLLQVYHRNNCNFNFKVIHFLLS